MLSTGLAHHNNDFNNHWKPQGHIKQPKIVYLETQEAWNVVAEKAHEDCDW